MNVARGLETARELTSRVEGAEARDAELAAKLAAVVDGTMPVLTGRVSGTFGCNQAIGQLYNSFLSLVSIHDSCALRIPLNTASVTHVWITHMFHGSR